MTDFDQLTKNNKDGRRLTMKKYLDLEHPETSDLWLETLRGVLVEAMKVEGVDARRLELLELLKGQSRDGMESAAGAFVREYIGWLPRVDYESDVFETEIDHDTTLVEKIAASRTLRLSTSTRKIPQHLSLDAMFPSNGQGKELVRFRFWNFNRPVTQEELKRLANERGRLLARAHELVGFYQIHVSLSDWPIIAPGQESDAPLWEGENSTKFLGVCGDEYGAVLAVGAHQYEEYNQKEKGWYRKTRFLVREP
ncbi:hypothetical protein L0Y40_00280 [Candidatus Wolfebacteria bacterium]|nr:hypothetical protein [Candidatus Wolfebacteria bacterium]